MKSTTNLINNSLKSASDDKINRPSSFEEACFQKGVYFLQHKTKIEFLPQILATGFLMPRSQQTKPNCYMGFSGNGSVVYLQSHLYDSGENMTKTLSSSWWQDRGIIKEANLACALLLFDLSLLYHRDDYYANTSWRNYGKKVDTSFLPKQVKDFINTPIASLEEICFSNPIDLSNHLSQIWVHPTKKEMVLQSLQEANLTGTWGDRIFGYEFHPTITYKMTFDDYTLQITPYDPNKTNQEINNEKPKLMSTAPYCVKFPPKQQEDNCLVPPSYLNQLTFSSP